MEEGKKEQAEIHEKVVTVSELAWMAEVKIIIVVLILLQVSTM